MTFLTTDHNRDNIIDDLLNRADELLSETAQGRAIYGPPGHMEREELELQMQMLNTAAQLVSAASLLELTKIRPVADQFILDFAQLGIGLTTTQ